MYTDPSNDLVATISVRVTAKLKQAVEREAKRRYLRPADFVRRVLSDAVISENNQKENNTAKE